LLTKVVSQTSQSSKTQIAVTVTSIFIGLIIRSSYARITDIKCHRQITNSPLGFYGDPAGSRWAMMRSAILAINLAVEARPVLRNK
jgi:hypothetical protein